MARACVLLAEGFEEIEAITIADVLRRAGVEAVLVGVAGTPVRGAHAIQVAADALLSDAAAEDWDAVILPGGMPGSKNLADSAPVRALLREQHGRGRRVAAICAAPIALSAAGVLEGKRATCYPGFEKELRGASLETRAVVVDGNVTTSRGPGTAFEFALELVSQLVGGKAAEDLRSGMLVPTAP